MKTSQYNNRSMRNAALALEQKIQRLKKAKEKFANKRPITGRDAENCLKAS